MEKRHIGYCPTPIGTLCIECTVRSVTRVYFTACSSGEIAVQPLTEASSVLQQTIFQLSEYFSGRRRIFDLPLTLAGSAFYSAVWNRLVHIPYGCTSSYGALAADLARPKASRAVGNASNHNPIVIIIPCHRVIGANGSLTGYAGGVERKQWLLNWEKSNLKKYIV